MYSKESEKTGRSSILDGFHFRNLQFLFFTLHSFYVRLHWPGDRIRPRALQFSSSHSVQYTFLDSSGLPLESSQKEKSPPPAGCLGRLKGWQEGPGATQTASFWGLGPPVSFL